MGGSSMSMVDLRTRSVQRKRILEHFEAGNTLTALEAIKRFGCIQLPSKIHTLRKLGYKIADEWVRVDTSNGRTHIKKYHLEQ